MTSGPRRDRDAAGRPRNARPRDSFGRPLPRAGAGGQSLPRDGQAPGDEPAPDDEQALPPGQALARAQALIDEGRAFRAHEVLEASWKAAPQPERELWRGLAQVAVGLTHAQRGNDRGAAALLRRGAERVGAYAPAPHGVDAAGVAGAARGLADRVEQVGLTAISPADLRVRLTR